MLRLPLPCLALAIIGFFGTGCNLVGYDTWAGCTRSLTWEIEGRKPSEGTGVSTIPIGKFERAQVLLSPPYELSPGNMEASVTINSLGRKPILMTGWSMRLSVQGKEIRAAEHEASISCTQNVCVPNASGEGAFKVGKRGRRLGIQSISTVKQIYQFRDSDELRQGRLVLRINMRRDGKKLNVQRDLKLRKYVEHFGCVLPGASFDKRPL